MKNPTKKRTFYIAIISLLLVAFSLFPVKANDKKVIRVAYPLMDGLSMKDEDGNYYGYNYDYLMQIAQYTGWEFEFVEVKGDTNQRITKLMEMLKNGEIDLMGDTKYVEALTKDYDYASEPYGNAYNVIAVRNDSDLYDLNGLLTKEDLKIGVLKSASKRGLLLDQYAKSNGLTYQQVLCDDIEDIENKIENKEIDAFLHVDLSLSKKYHAVARFSPDPFFFITTKGNSQIMSELNKALSTINQVNPTFSSSLYNRYFSENSTDISLNEVEKKFLENHSKITVLVRDGSAPIQYYEDTATGVAKDVLSKLSKDTKVQFQYLYAKDYAEYEKLANSDKVDMVLGLPYEIKIANKMNMNLSEPYLSSKLSLVTYKGVNPSKLDGLKQAITPYNLNISKEAETETYDTPEDVLKALNNHKSDYTYISSYMYTYYLNKYGFENLSSFESADYLRDQYAFGVTKSDDLTLLSILNKAIRSQSSDINTYIYKNAYVEKQFVLSSFIYDNLLLISIILFILILLILNFIRSYYKKQLKMKKAVEIEYKRYQMLSDISGEMTFSYDYLRDYVKVANSGIHKISDEQIIHDFSKLDICNSQYSDILKLLRSLLLEVKNVSSEFETRLLNGDLNWYQISINIVRDDMSKDQKQAVYAVGKVVDIQKEKLEKENLRVKSETDNLTGILNRGGAEKAISQALLRNDERGILIMFDLDNFKSVNDIYGHIEGDKVLIETAQLLMNLFDGNIISRLGGDEFIVYIDNINDLQLQKLCEKTLEQIQRMESMKNKSIVLSVSMGIAHTKGCENFIELLKLADENLYKVKRNGRNNYLIS